MEKMRNAVSNSYFVLLLSVAGIFVGYLLRIFLSRTLSIEEFGLFYAVSAFIGLFTIIRYLGLNQALVKFIPEFLIKNEKGKIKSSIITVLIFQTVTIVAFTTIVYLFREPLSSSLFKSPAAESVLLLMMLSFLPSMFFAVFQSVFQGYQKLRTYAMVEPVRITLTFLFSVLFIQMGATGVALAYLIAACATTLIFMKDFRKLGMGKSKSSIESGLVSKILRFSTPVFVSSIAVIIITYTDTIIITLYRTLDEVALYQVAMPTSQLLLVFSSSIAAVAFPLISELYSRKRTGEIEKGVRVMVTLLLLLVVPFVALLVTYPETILGLLFSPAFTPASLTLQVLAVSMIFYSVFTVFQTTIDGIGKPFINTKIMFCMAGTNLVLNLALVPPLGITGSAFASLTAYALGAGLCMRYVRIHTGTRLRIKRIGKIFAGGIVAGIVMYAFKILPLAPYEKFALSIVAGGLVYVWFAAASKLVTADDIKFIESRGNMPFIVKRLIRIFFRRKSSGVVS